MCSLLQLGVKSRSSRVKFSLDMLLVSRHVGPALATSSPQELSHFHYGRSDVCFLWLLAKGFSGWLIAVQPFQRYRSSLTAEAWGFDRSYVHNQPHNNPDQQYDHNQIVLLAVWHQLAVHPTVACLHSDTTRYGVTTGSGLIPLFSDIVWLSLLQVFSNTSSRQHAITVQLWLVLPCC